jgi:autotransporter translocation and assembly factor TamB
MAASERTVVRIMKSKIAILVLLLLVACGTKHQVPAASPGPRMAIAIQYVAVPQMTIYAQPNDVAPVLTTYAYTETVSILAKQGDWVEVRTVDGSGWAHAKDLLSAQGAAAINGETPRFMTPPVAIPNNGRRGELGFEARVNTDGDVVEVKMVKNTTGSEPLANANAEALKAARFYPLIQNRAHVAFTYQHHVYY